MSDFHLPAGFDFAAYRSSNWDLLLLPRKNLLNHYMRRGKYQGRLAHRVATRQAFASLVPQSAEALEIGPFFSPLLNGPKVRYCDIMSREELQQRAVSIGADPSAVPPIHYLLKPNEDHQFDRTFDCILSSHCIEHQPDFIRHLQWVARAVCDEGRYFLLIPDMRYCFDSQMRPSHVADVLEAYQEQRKVHTLRSVLEHRGLTTHNDSALHWKHRPCEPLADPNLSRIAEALQEFERAQGRYIDVHAWYFTPDSFKNLIDSLYSMKQIPFQVERLYRTLHGAGEFWVILKKEKLHKTPEDEIAEVPEVIPREDKAPFKLRIRQLLREVLECFRLRKFLGRLKYISQTE